MTDGGYRAGQQRWTRGRVISAAGAAGLQSLLVWVLVAGLAVGAPARIIDNLKLFAVTPPPPPPRTIPDPPKATSRKAQGKASPANLRARPSDIVAPPPPTPLPPPPLAAAPKAGPDSAASAGAAPVAGPGTGAGGTGDGSGGGGDGDGDGGVPLQWIKGRIKDSDYPDNAWRAGVSGTVYLRFIVGVEGRVTSCKVTTSSGSPDLDNTTCRLIIERFRYRPGRDRHGRPIPQEVSGYHRWELWRRDNEDDPDDQRP